MTRPQSGFTLIELLVIIAILAILVGVVVFIVGGSGGSGLDSFRDRCEADGGTWNASPRGDYYGFCTGGDPR